MIIFLSSDGPGDMVTDGAGDGEYTGTAKSGPVNTTDTTEGINYLSLSIFSKVERGLSFYHFSLFSLFFFPNFIDAHLIFVNLITGYFKYSNACIITNSLF